MAICANLTFLSTVATSLVGMSLAVMVLVIAIAYMAAQFFRKPEYEAFASVEIYQVFVSAVIFITIFGATCFAAEMAEALAGKDPYDFGREYLTYLSNEIALKTVIKLQGSLLFSQFMGSWTMRWGPGAWGTVVLAFPSFIVIERVIDFLLLLITPFTASLMVQQTILEALKGTVLPFLLPAAVLLRIFPPTRDASSFLIAAAIGFGIIFPYTYVMHSYIVRWMIAVTFAQAAGTNMEQSLAAQYPNISADISSFGFFSYYNLLFRPLTSLSFLLLQALFLPALSISLTVAFIKGFSKFISQKLV
jgi:hypothetical protein